MTENLEQSALPRAKAIFILLSLSPEMKLFFRRYDGPLIRAMREGHIILLDEISLAEDSVLERLNSVLEPSRTITLAERGGEVSRNVSIPVPREHLAISDARCFHATR